MGTLSWLSVLPPIIVVAMAIRTKNIIVSLVVGLMCGLGVYSVLAVPPANGNILDIMLFGLRLMTESISSEDNILLLLFLSMLGGIIAILTAAGCANSFSASALKRLHSKRSAEFFTFGLGCLIFVDDYFNAITVGNVMVSITDRFRISRAKLAYLIDSTSAPVTILMPVSSWVATVISLIIPALALNGMAQPGMQVFLKATVFNYYAWFTLLLVLLVIIFEINIGPMRRFEEGFSVTGEDKSIYIDINESFVDDMGEKHRGTAHDLIIVLCFLVLFTLFVMLYTGGVFEGVCVAEAFMCCDPSISLAAAAFVTLLLCFIIFVLPGKLSLSKFSSAFLQGVKSMVTSIVILILSWTFSGLMGNNGIMTGAFLADFFSGWLSGGFLPVVIFIVSAMIAFSTGASWGAMSIMIPTAIAICASVDPAMLYLVVGATLSGSVFGDHCSPLADTTVLSSSGAGCRHLDHVNSQLPYAAIVAFVSAVCFAAAGLSNSCLLPFVLGTVLLIFIAIMLRNSGSTEKIKYDKIITNER